MGIRHRGVLEFLEKRGLGHLPIREAIRDGYSKTGIGFSFSVAAEVGEDFGLTAPISEILSGAAPRRGAED